MNNLSLNLFRQKHREAEKQVAFKPVQDEHDEAEDKIKQVKDITKETTKTPT